MELERAGRPEGTTHLVTRSTAIVAAFLGALILLVALVALASARVQASFSCSPSCTVTAGTTVTFTSTSTSSSAFRNYEWDLDGDSLFGAADNPDEPNGPSAQSASRAFAAVGSFQVGLRVTNASAEQSTAFMTVTVSSAPPPPPPPPPPGEFEQVPTSFAHQTIHGPFVLDRRELVRASSPRRPPYRLPGEFEEELPELEAEPVCGASVCFQVPPELALHTSPSLAGTPFTCCENEIDPQIAVSKSTVLVGLRDHVQAFDKAGTPLLVHKQPVLLKQPVLSKHRRDFFDATETYDVPLCKLFKPLIADINAHIPLPTDLKDNDGIPITVANGYGINCDKQTGGTLPDKWAYDRVQPPDAPPGITDEDFYWPNDEFFDARVLWDEYHDRFVIAALVMNHNAIGRKAQARTDPGSVNQGSYNAALARRSLTAVAVSRSDDPRDGWYEYWLWGYPGADSCPNNHCPFHGAADYMSAGISSKYLVLENVVNDQNVQGVPKEVNMPDLINGKSRREITMLPTAPLVGGQGPLNQQPAIQNSGPYINPDGTEVGEIIQPALQHKPDLGIYQLFASKWNDTKMTQTGSDDEKKVLLWALKPEGDPKMYVTVLPLQTYRDVDANAPQKTHADFMTQFQATAGLATNSVNKLVYRKGRLYLTFDTCAKSGDAQVSGSFEPVNVCQRSMLRYARIKLNGIDNFGGTLNANLDVEIDGGFGASESEPSDDAWYAFPTVEANADGNAALVFHRTSPTVYPEARYTVSFLNELNPRSSKVLQNGDYTLGRADLGYAPEAAGFHHYAGMSVDPYDHTAIWMIQGYATKRKTRSGIWRYAIGKVFGKLHPNLELGNVFLNRAVAGSGGFDRLGLRLGDLGDAGARPSKARVFLSRGPRGQASGRRGGGDIVLKTIRVPRIASGRLKTLKLKLRIPTGERFRRYRFLGIKLDVKRRIREYDEHDNTLLVPLR